MLFRVPLYLQLLSLCYLCLSHSVPDMDFRLILALFSQNLSVVLFPKPMVHFFQEYSRFVCSESFGKNFAMYCIAPRNDFSSFLSSDGFSFNMASLLSSFGLIPFSSISCPSHLFRFKKNSNFLLLALYLAFSSLFKMSNSFFSSSCLFSRVTTILSSSQAGVQY